MSYLVDRHAGHETRTTTRWPWLLLLVVIIAIGAGIAFVMSQQADSARMAMAAGQYGKAHDYYLEEANKGNPSAQNALGNLYYLGLGVERDYGSARDWYFEAAKVGYGDAHLNLGHLYKQGLGVANDPVRAFGWYNMAHRHGNLAAEYYLTQVTVEWTLSPLMINTAQTKWSKLEALLNETL